MADTSSGVTYQPVGDIVSSSKCWMRKYDIKVYEHNQGTVSFKNTDGTTDNSEKFTQPQDGDVVLDVSKLRCTFDVKRYAQYNPNTAIITIYNLTADAETKIISEGYRVVITAGYESGVYGDIFDGYIIATSRTKQNGTDYILTIQAMDGYFFLQFGMCNFSVQRGADARTVVKNIANQASVPVDIAYPKDGDTSVLDTQKFSRGQSVHGLASKSLDDIAKALNATWFVDMGKLYFMKYGESTDDMPLGKQAVVLSPSTGLIGNPTQIEYGISAKCFLNAMISPFCFVQLNPEYVTRQLLNVSSSGVSNPQLYPLDPQGIYRVISCEFVGDTRGNDWYTQVSAVTQSGNVPDILKNGVTMN